MIKHVGMARLGARPGEPGVNDNGSELEASGRRADAVAQSGDADHLGAVLAAEERAVLFESVTDDADAAVLAGRRQRVDRAFEAVEGVGGAVHAYLKRLVVIVTAYNQSVLVRHCAPL